MQIFLAGASGALGVRLAPMLVSAGHHVVGMTRTAAKAEKLRALGIEPVVADGLDAGAVMKAVLQARPDVVVHEMTSLKMTRGLRNFDREFELTNRLRTEGTAHLLAAAQAAVARRFVAQSYAGWPFGHNGKRPRVEDDPFDPHPLKTMERSLDAIRNLEKMVTGATHLTGIVLRYGSFYGPGTALGDHGELLEMVRRRRVPVFGDGAGIWSFIHIDDAARATVAAIEQGPPGVYNIVDDEPAAASQWLPDLARAVGAKPPRHLPSWTGKLLLGEAVLSMMTETPGSSNAKAKRLLGWRPWYSSWRYGFRNALSGQLADLSLRPS